MAKAKTTNREVTSYHPGHAVLVILDLSTAEQTKDLVAAGEALCAKTGMHLRLVHVTEPWVGAAAMGLMPMPQYEELMQGEMMRRAEEQLRTLQEKVSRDIRSSLNVLTGPLLESVLAEAQNVRAALIVCGSRSSQRSFFPSGLSVAISLMAHAPIPVLAIPQGSKWDQKKKGTLLVGDDLSRNGGNVVRAAADFAAHTELDLLHLYVNPLDEKTLDTALSMAANAARHTIEPALKPSQYLKKLRELMQEHLEAHGAEAEKLLAPQKCKYESRVVEGDPETVIEDLTRNAKNKIAILAFGRHHSFHTKPFLVGRLSFKTMLRQDKPVLMIPV